MNARNIATTLLPMILVLALGACNKQQPAPEVAPAPANEAAATAGTSAPAVRHEGTTRLPIGAGVAVPSEFQVRSGRAQTQPGGMADHVLRVEFSAMDASAAAKALRKAFEQNGYTMVDTDMKDDVGTYIMRDKTTRLRFVVVPKGKHLKIQLVEPDARGLVTLYWRAPAVGAR